jgi:3-oxoadipate enol-lactonase
LGFGLFGLIERKITMPKIKVNDIEMYYEIHGEGEPIVFVTGFSGDHTLYDQIAKQAAAKGYQAIVFDSRGCGQTDSPNYPYTTEMMADDAVGLIKALQLNSVNLVGSSFGGCIVQTILHKYPEIAKSAVLANTTSQFSVRGRLYAESRLELMKAGAPNDSIVKIITMLCWSNKYLSRPGRIECLIAAGFFPITLAGYESQLNALLTFDSAAWFKNIKTPCLIISSDDDLLVSATECEALAHNNPSAEYYCFNDTGHMPILEQPEQFNKLVFDFIAKRQ